MAKHELSAIGDTTAHVAVLLQVLPCGVLIEDERGEVTYRNDVLLAQFGFDHASSIHMAIASRAADPLAFAARIEELAASTEARTDDVVMADGRIFERDYLPVVDGGTRRGRVWTYWDFTERKHAEQARERGLRAEILAQRLGVRAHQNRADEAERDRDELEENSAVRERLMATASHELRTPLTSISSFAELLSEDVTGDALEFVQAIRRNAQRMLGLVDNLLLMARIRSGVEQIDREPVALAAVVAEVAQDLGARAGWQDRIRVGAVGSTMVRGSRARLVQIVTNLVENGLKYSEDTVDVRIGERDGAAWLTVQDRGVGIASEDVERVFEQFFRTGSARGSALPGSGLGLAVVRALVEQLQGEVALRSTIGVGTTVEIRLPLA